MVKLGVENHRIPAKKKKIVMPVIRKHLYEQRELLCFMVQATVSLNQWC